MSKFKNVVSYFLIFTLLLNNALTSVSNTAWASHLAEDKETQQRKAWVSTEDNPLDPVSAAKIQQGVTEEWEEKYTLKGLGIGRVMWAILATIIGFLALNAWEPINSKTLFPKLGIPKLGFGTEEAFYEATAAIHGMMFLGIVAYSYTIFKFALKVSSPIKAIFLKTKSYCLSPLEEDKPSDIEKAKKNQPKKEENLKAEKKQIFRKWNLPKILGTTILEITNIGAAITYSMIVVSYFRLIEKKFPNFSNFSTPFLASSIIVDKLMTGHTKIGSVVQWLEEKRWGKRTVQHRHDLKKRIESARNVIQQLNLKNPKDRNTLLRLIEAIFPESDLSSFSDLDPEDREISLSKIDKEVSSSDERDSHAIHIVERKDPNIHTVGRIEGSIARKRLQKKAMIRGKDNSFEETTVSYSHTHGSSAATVGQGAAQEAKNHRYSLQSHSSPINFKEVYNFINKQTPSSEGTHNSKIAYRLLSYLLCGCAFWGLSTTMTQGLERTFGNPQLAAIFGSYFGLWVAFAESKDIFKALGRIITPLLPHKVIAYFVKRDTGKSEEANDATNQTKKSSILEFLARVPLYRGILATTAWAYTFFEIYDYLNEEGEDYKNFYTKANYQHPVLKWAGFAFLNIFEILSHMHLQHRGYMPLKSRLVTQLIMFHSDSPPKMRLSAYRERLVGVFDVMLKTVDRLTDDELEDLEKLIPLNTNQQPYISSGAQDLYNDDSDSSQEIDPEQRLLINDN